MTKAHPLGFRVESQIKETLEKAAKEDHQSVSLLLETILPERLRAEGLLQTKASS
ncbi:hypothetical protein [Methylobacterium tarhaniae]|uniref:hypothetical protein n=1 Tax=Methylobacterium tarhaniae TaxID=1187852 RepID=UPI000B0DD50B|nr:hypothetical protein [Methylobacterium tarhaniae]